MADPTDYYTSRYSGEEIDNLLDIVKNGGGGGGDFADLKLGKDATRSPGQSGGGGAAEPVGQLGFPRRACCESTRTDIH